MTSRPPAADRDAPRSLAGPVAAGAAVVTVVVVITSLLGRGGGAPAAEPVALPPNPHVEAGTDAPERAAAAEGPARGGEDAGWRLLARSSGRPAEDVPIRASIAPLDFGIVPPGGVRTRELLLANAVARPVTIDEIRPNCGCTRVSGFDAAVELAPAGTLALEVTMEAGDAHGSRRNKKLFVVVEGERLHVPVRIRTTPARPDDEAGDADDARTPDVPQAPRAADAPSDPGPTPPTPPTPRSGAD